MDKDIKDFNEFWDAYKVNEIRFPRRRAATFRAWNERTPAARKAMLAKVQAEGAPEWKNPYFYVTDFPEPVPYNWNGDRRIEEMMRAGKIVSACYKGRWGMYSIEDVQDFGLKVKNEK